jgi:hypothetical protein
MKGILFLYITRKKEPGGRYMLNNIKKSKILPKFFVTVVVFLMTAGAYIGATDQTLKDRNNNTDVVWDEESLSDAASTQREDIEELSNEKEIPIDLDYKSEEIPDEFSAEVDFDAMENLDEESPNDVNMDDEPEVDGETISFTLNHGSMELLADEEIESVVNENELTKAIGVITNKIKGTNKNEEVIGTNSPRPANHITTPLSGSSIPVTLSLGADNPEYSGEAQGYSQKSSSLYSSSSIYNVQPQFINQGGITIEKRGWTVFDLKDLNEWKGVSVQEAKLKIHNYNMLYVKQINFTLLSTTPSHNPSTTPVNIPQKIFTESGPTGTYIGNYSSAVFTDSVQRNLVVPLNEAAVNAINSKLNKIPTPKYYTFAIGMFIADKYTSICQVDWRDIRLEVSFTSEGEIEKGVAFGDDWSGYVKWFNDPHDEAGGYLKTNLDKSSWKNGSYAMWDMDNITRAWSSQNLTREIKVNKLTLRFNHYSGWAKDIEIRHMENPIEQQKGDAFESAMIWKDINDGDIYYKSSQTKAETMVEYEWPLNQKARDVFMENINNGDKFFAVGWRATTTAGNTISYSPKLVVDWEYDVTARLEDEQPEGFEGIPLLFNATPSFNLSGGTGGLRYEWDWDNDGKFDETTTSPLVSHTWYDDHRDKITLRVNDTITDRNDSKTYTVVIRNVYPVVNKTNGNITPQPAWELSPVTFSGYTVDDPGIDTWTYLWDFDGDLEYDVSGACVGKTVPTETWYYDDDFYGKVSLLILDDDGGTSNFTVPYTVEIKTPNAGTGYISNSSGMYSHRDYDRIYMYWYPTYEYRRGWAQWDLGQIPDDVIISKMKVKGYMYYDSYSVLRTVSVRILDTMPRIAANPKDAEKVWKEAGNGIKLFDLSWKDYTSFTEDITLFLDTEDGKNFINKALTNGWIGLGFTITDPTYIRVRGYINGFSRDPPPTLEIEYLLQEPGCLIPITVENMPPVINCTNLTITPKAPKEGDILQVSNISFCDPGNDTYKAKIKVGAYESDWIPLGGYRARGDILIVDGNTLLKSPGVAMTEKAIKEMGLNVTVARSSALPTGWSDPDVYDAIIWHGGASGGGGGSGWGTICPNDAQIAGLTSYVMDGGHVMMSGHDIDNTRSYPGNPGPMEIAFFNTVLHHYVGRLWGGGNSGVLASGRIDVTEPAHPIFMTPNQMPMDWNLYPNPFNNTYYLWTYNPHGLLPGGEALAYSETGRYRGEAIIVSDVGGGYGKTCLIRHPMEFLWDATSKGDMLTPIIQNIVTWFLGDTCEAWGVSGPGCHKLDWSLEYTIPDDHPNTATAWDELNVSVIIRDDDHNLYIPGSSGIGGPPGIATIYVDSYYSYSGFNGRKIIYDTNYNLYSIYIDYGDGYSVKIARSSAIDMGATWQTVGKVSSAPWFTGRQYYPTLAIDSNNILHTVWRGTDGSRYDIRYACSRDGGVTWGENYNLTTFGSPYYPVIAVDGNDNVHIAWYSSNVIYYRNRSAAGVWGIESFVATNYATNPDICTDSNNNVHIVWQGRKTGSSVYNIQHKILWASNGTWSSINDVTADTSSARHYYPIITVENNDDLHVTWQGYDNVATGADNIMYAKYDSSTQTWGAREYITQITSGSPRQYNPSIAVNKAGEIDVVWHGYQYPSLTSPYAIHHAQKIGTSWEVDWNFYPGHIFHDQMYASLLCSPPNCIAKDGFAFVWYDSYYFIKYYTSEDFKIDNPEFTDGEDQCNYKLNVTNVKPKLNMSAIGMFHAYESTEFDLAILFDDPGIGIPTEVFEYNVDWGDGNVTGWTTCEDRHIEDLLSGYNPEEGFANKPIFGEYSFNEKPITSMYVVTRQNLGYSGTGSWHIKIDGFNKSAQAWEEIYYYHSTIDPGPFERTFPNPIYTRWRIEFFDYYNPARTFNYYYEYTVEDLPTEGGYIITKKHMYPDDHPETGTPWDLFNITIDIRDDDLGTSHTVTNITVHDIPPDIIEGTVTPETLAEEGISEGTLVTLKNFKFDDIAYNVPTEREYGFNYSIDWGDGTPPTPWANDFMFTNYLRGYWQFDDGTGNTASDSSGYNNHGTIINATWTTGKFGDALNFDGIDDYVDCGNDTSFDITLENTVSAWIKSNSEGNIVAKDSQGPIPMFYDTFTDSNKVLTSHTPDIGTGWTVGYSKGGGNPYINNNQLYDDGVGGSSDGFIAIASDAPPTPDYAVSVRVAQGDTSDDTITLVARWLDSKNTYGWKFSGSSSLTYNRLFKMVNGVKTVLSTSVGTVTTNDVVALQVIGTTITCIKNGKVVVSITDNSLTKAGKGGVGHGAFENSGDDLSSQRTDDFKIIAKVADSDVPIIDNDVPFLLRTVNGGEFLIINDSIPYKVTTSTNVNDGSWHHIVATYDGSEMRLYVDGKLENTSTEFSGNLPINNRSVRIGEKLTGIIDEVAIFNRVLTANDIQLLYNSGGGGAARGFGSRNETPTLSHLYRDDNPSGTDQDVYNLTLRIRDDDMGIGEWVLPVKIQNVWPIIDKSELELELVGEENALYLPEIKFVDPGTGPNETWSYWLDVDDSEDLTPVDLTGPVTTTTVIDDVTYGTIPPIKTPFNDDYTRRVGIYIYDDDVVEADKFHNVSYQKVISEFQDFESGSTYGPWGNWQNTGTSTTYYWRRDSGGTPSSSTGPSTGANGTTWYIYTETSGVYLRTFTLERQGIDFDAIPIDSIEFYYHMYGSAMGSLYLEENTGGSWNILWSKSGNQGNTWFKETVDLSMLSGTGTIRFRGYSGTSFTSDMALDQILISGLEDYELTMFKTKFDVTTENAAPEIIAPEEPVFAPGEDMQLRITLKDQGSDDLYCKLDWGDGSSTNLMTFYNNGRSPEPVYPPTPSAMNGTAPFEVEPELFHTYYMPGTYLINVTLWDDDQWVKGQNGTKLTLYAKVLNPKELKESAAKMLEPLIPGHLDHLGYRNITLRYNGPDASALHVYNYIARPPYYWSETLYLTICNVKSGDILEINGSYLDEGMFGTSLILKLYDNEVQLINKTEIPTAATCIDPLEVGQTFGLYKVLGFGKVIGISYHHYSKFALKTEDALDHILRSINRDPRRGYGWWHQIWVWWCGYTHFRELWIDNVRLDPQFGAVVFCEERWAARRLMEVVLNCLNPEGVSEIEFEYIGPGTVDIEAYTSTDTWWFTSWKWIHREYDLKNGDSFILNASMCNSTKLGDRIMFRVYDANTGAQNDIIYVRTSGQWPLEVMPGNIYNEYWKITNSTLITSENYTMWALWGDANWWDLYFNFWSRAGDSRCGWDVNNCSDPVIANQEKRRVCSNLTVIWEVIKLLMIADKLLVQVAYSDAENLTIVNGSYAEEYKYHLKMAKRYSYSATREAKKGRPHHAITDYKRSWKHSIMAMKYAFKSNEEEKFEEPYDKCNDTCPCMFEYPWWMEWYITWCNWENPSYEENCGC